MVESCAAFCVIEVQMVSWNGNEYESAIEPGATIATGSARFEPVGNNTAGAGQSLVLDGGVSGQPDGGLAVPHTEIWQSIEGAPFQRVDWLYDREAEGNDCLGLRLVEADMALHAADAIGYGKAIDLYSQALDPSLVACSLYGISGDDELILLQGLASFRLMQAQALDRDSIAARATLLALQAGQPDGRLHQGRHTVVGELHGHGQRSQCLFRRRVHFHRERRSVEDHGSLRLQSSGIAGSADLFRARVGAVDQARPIKDKNEPWNVHSSS